MFMPTRKTGTRWTRAIALIRRTLFHGSILARMCAADEARELLGRPFNWQ